MKRGFVLGFVLVLSLSIISAGAWDNIFLSATGKVVASGESFSYKCNKDSSEICNWYAGENGESCKEVCRNYGSVKEPCTWNDDDDCVVMEYFFGECDYCNGGYADGRLPAKQDDEGCFYRNTEEGKTAVPSANSKTIARPVCACNEGLEKETQEESTAGPG